MSNHVRKIWSIEHIESGGLEIYNKEIPAFVSLDINKQHDSGLANIHLEFTKGGDRIVLHDTSTDFHNGGSKFDVDLVDRVHSFTHKLDVMAVSLNKFLTKIEGDEAVVDLRRLARLREESLATIHCQYTALPDSWYRIMITDCAKALNIRTLCKDEMTTTVTNLISILGDIEDTVTNELLRS